MYDDVSEIRGSYCHHTILYLRWDHEITEDELRTLVCVGNLHPEITNDELRHVWTSLKIVFKFCDYFALSQIKCLHP